MNPTIAYMTIRREPCFAWFLESLARQCDPASQPVIIVDYFADDLARRAQVEAINGPLGFPIKHVTPKPSVWQGRFKLTREDCFDAGNARNTALCLAETDHIAWVDDVSVLEQTWYSRVLLAMKRPGITFGSYRKVKNLKVLNGRIESLSDHPQGHDPRRRQVKDLKREVRCDPRWLFGCSLLAPVQSMLDMNGWPEQLCAGMGYEDCVMAFIVMNNRILTTFDPLMMSVESEEHHHLDTPFKRWDPCKGDPNANPKDDKSHAVLRIAAELKASGNGYSMADLRRSVLDGNSFPIPTTPTHEWFTGAALTDLTFQ